MDRKEFMIKMGRWSSIGFLAFLLGILIRKQAISLNANCDNEFCQSCGKRDSCDQIKTSDGTE